MWRVTFGRPASGAVEDFSVEALGVPGGFLFLRNDRYWQ
jgi:hypothetical protein